MASLQKNYSKQKLTGEVYTPDFIVEKILDDAQFSGKKILGKKILDPACGDGQFLEQIASRIIKFSKPEKLKENLQKIYGWDTHKKALELAKARLNSLISNFGIKIVWNLEQKNALLPHSTKFDFIVGNPPYIRIQHLEKAQREYIKQNFSFCKSGSTDIFIAFYEQAGKLLSENGICAFITPNSFFSTQTAKPLRRYFEEYKNLFQISNYADIQLFENATTYSAIVIFGTKTQKYFLYQHANSKTDFAERKISFSEIENQKFWQLSTQKNDNQKGKRLGDICKIHVGLTTLADKLYIFKLLDKKAKTLILQSKNGEKFEFEAKIFKPIIKASTLKNCQNKPEEYILFPYCKTSEGTKIISEGEIKKKYPLTYKYLQSIKPNLEKRDNGKPNKTAWYAFGRSQGLETSFGKKILFSPMNKKPNFIFCEDENSTFYSGYCIKYKGDYKELLKKLNSPEMEEYIKIAGRDFRGGWKAYNKKIVQEFKINLK